MIQGERENLIGTFNWSELRSKQCALQHLDMIHNKDNKQEIKFSQFWDYVQCVIVSLTRVTNNANLNS